MNKRQNEFTGKNILFTGDMHLINDKWLYWLLCEMADAEYKKGVSKKIDIVVTGAKAGPSKLSKIEELKAEGCKIEVIDEESFIMRYFELETLPDYISFNY